MTEQLPATPERTGADDAPDRRILLAALAFARRALVASAASVATFDEQRFELRYEAVSGAGSEELIDTRISAGTGISGLVLRTREAVIVSDLAHSAEFNRDVAEQSGYVPDVICASPLLYDDEVLGVLEVLDPEPGRFSELELMGILEALADQVATSLHVLRQLRRFSADRGATHPARARLADLVEELPEHVLTDGRGSLVEVLLRELGSAPAAAGEVR